MSVFKKIAASVLSLELLLGCEQPQQQAMHVAGNEIAQVVEESVVDERPAINVGNAVVVPRLAINEEDFWTVRYANEQQGIRELREIAENSMGEEAWIYLPQFNAWLEVGEPAMAYADETDVNVHTKINEHCLLEIVEQNKRIDEVQLWHNHPNSRITADAALQYYANVSEEIQNEEYFRAGFQLAMPSFEDFNGDGEVDGDFRVYTHLYKMLAMINPDINFSAGICSDSGVLRFAFTQEGSSRYANMETAEIMRELAEQYLSIPQIELPEHLFKESDEKKIEERKVSVITDLCGQMSNRYFSMTFLPHR